MSTRQQHAAANSRRGSGGQALPGVQSLSEQRTDTVQLNHGSPFQQLVLDGDDSEWGLDGMYCVHVALQG